jgi:outer membrane protein assembly factor BamB
VTLRLALTLTISLAACGRGNPDVDDVDFHEGPLGVSLIYEVTFEGNESHSYDLHILDATTGKLRAAVKMGDDSFSIIGTSPQLVWVRQKDTVQAYDLGTGRRLLDQAALLKHPVLAAGISFSSYPPKVLADGSLQVTANDGRQWRVDPTTFEPGPVLSDKTPDSDSSGTSRYIEVGGTRFELQGSPRTVMTPRSPDGNATSVESEWPGFVNGNFLTNQSGAVLFDAPPSVLVVHDSRVDNPHDQLLSRVTTDGKVLWTINLASQGVKGDIEKTRIVGTSCVVFVDGDNAGHAVALDKDGKIVWKTRL